MVSFRSFMALPQEHAHLGCTGCVYGVCPVMDNDKLRVYPRPSLSASKVGVAQPPLATLIRNK